MACRSWPTPRRPSSIPANSCSPCRWRSRNASCGTSCSMCSWPPGVPIAWHGGVIREARRGGEPGADRGPVARRARRTAAVEPPAAGLWAVAYAFSGAVLFQYCNVVFLVGAAWLPWTLLAMHTCCMNARFSVGAGRGRVPGADGARGRSPVRLPCRTARDPLRRHRSSGGWRMRRTTASELRSANGSRRLGAVGRLATSAVAGRPAGRRADCAGLVVGRQQRPRRVHLSAQRLRNPGLSAARARPPAQAASRCLGNRPGSWAGVAHGSVGSPRHDEHHGQAYRFSVAPWRLVEMLWPNVSGRTFPQNHRWLSAAGAEDRIWTPSLYLGILPLLLGIGTWRLRSADRV